MEIKYTNYADGVHEFDFKVPVGTLGLGKPFFGNLNLHCKMDKSSSQIVLDSFFDIGAILVCDRCLAEFEKIFSGSFELVYLFTKKEDLGEDDNVYYLSPEESKINVKPDLLEFVNLSLPMKILCKEDCKGLCSKCGADLNLVDCNCNKEEINLIWAPLLKLKD
ncbi:MAG: DUF177 domain-containing protein [Melioribacteraceae bacterium]|nr:DUF177 domain-containing protein [Melioribacteraceae bacterium]MCF8264433.1 DUF177 domain-containing protein [Melioribacteraceae bacterium]MCF8432214.1 DUF177 domain-containing protein [Melioribacteraceae bacterium]